MLKRSIPDVRISAKEIGHAIAKASDHEQRRVLIAWADGVDNMHQLCGSWAEQSKFIVEGKDGGESLSACDRERIAAMLETLVAHLRAETCCNA